MVSSRCLLLLLMPTLYCLAQNVSELKSTQKCPNLPKLHVVPGFGWDALTSKDMSQLIEITYKECKVTTDGKYLIPDGTEAIIVKTKDLQLSAELIEHWSNYSSITGRGFQFGFDIGWSGYFGLSNTFSIDYQNAKALQVKYKAFVSRIQLRNLLYRLQIGPTAPTTHSLRERFLKVIRAVSRNQTQVAEYLLQLIVRDYGTHYTKSIDIGAVFIKEDFLKKTFLYEHSTEKSKIIASAKLSVLDSIGFSARINKNLDQSLYEEYQRAVVDKKIRAIGGPNWDSSPNAEKWLAATADNMVVIDRSGDLITEFISPSKFPNAPIGLLKKVYEMFTDVIKKYYSYNIRKGCTQTNSANFDYTANLDDGSCEAIPHNHSFGGVFQACHQPRNTQITNQCNGYVITNPLTGSTRCPSGFKQISLYSETKSYTYSKNYPWHECSGWWLWKKCWWNDDWRFHSDTFQVTTFQCIAAATPSLRPTSYQFGGIYSPEVTNMHTQKNSCPVGFMQLHAVNNRIKICVKNNVNSRNLYTVPFGGLTSCKLELRCPNGYHGHLATIYQGCQFNYCLHSTDLKQYGKTLLPIRPPFLNGSVLFHEESDEEFDDYGIPIQKSLSVENNNSMEIVNYAGVSEDEYENTKSPYIGLTVSFCLLITLVALGVAYWQRGRVMAYLEVLLHANIAVQRTRELESSEKVANCKSKGPLLMEKTEC